jgi:hypothetical protein
MATFTDMTFGSKSGRKTRTKDNDQKENRAGDAEDAADPSARRPRNGGRSTTGSARRRFHRGLGRQTF